MPVFRELMCFPIIITTAGNAAQTVTRTVVVVDTIAPVISLHGDANITHQSGNAYLDANASWSDLVDGMGVIVASGEVNASVPGTYLLSFNYTDTSGNAAQTVTRTVVVVDTTAPVISLHGDAITHEAGNPYIDANASWSDLGTEWCDRCQRRGKCQRSGNLFAFI